MALLPRGGLVSIVCLHACLACAPLGGKPRSDGQYGGRLVEHTGALVGKRKRITNMYKETTSNSSCGQSDRQRMSSRAPGSSPKIRDPPEESKCVNHWPGCASRQASRGAERAVDVTVDEQR